MGSGRGVVHGSDVLAGLRGHREELRAFRNQFPRVLRTAFRLHAVDVREGPWQKVHVSIGHGNGKAATRTCHGRWEGRRVGANIGLSGYSHPSIQMAVRWRISVSVVGSRVVVLLV